MIFRLITTRASANAAAMAFMRLHCINDIKSFHVKSSCHKLHAGHYFKSVFFTLHFIALYSFRAYVTAKAAFWHINPFKS